MQDGLVVVVDAVLLGARGVAVEVDQLEGQLLCVVAHQLEQIARALALAALVEEVDAQR